MQLILTGSFGRFLLKQPQQVLEWWDLMLTRPQKYSGKISGPVAFPMTCSFLIRRPPFWKSNGGSDGWWTRDLYRACPAVSAPCRIHSKLNRIYAYIYPNSFPKWLISLSLSFLYINSISGVTLPPSPATHSPTPQQSVSFFIPSPCACNVSQCEPFQSSVGLCEMCSLCSMDILQWINRLQGEENLEKRPRISLTFAFYYDINITLLVTLTDGFGTWMPESFLWIRITYSRKIR